MYFYGDVMGNYKIHRFPTFDENAHDRISSKEVGKQYFRVTDK